MEFHLALSDTDLVAHTSHPCQKVCSQTHICLTPHSLPSAQHSMDANKSVGGWKAGKGVAHRLAGCRQSNENRTRCSPGQRSPKFQQWHMMGDPGMMGGCDPCSRLDKQSLEMQNPSPGAGSPTYECWPRGAQACPSPRCSLRHYFPQLTHGSEDGAVRLPREGLRYSEGP